MSVLTTTPLTCLPPAAVGLTVSTGAGAWVSGAWVELLASTPTPLAVAGVQIKGSYAATDWELDLGTGAAGAEVVRSTLRLYLYNSGSQTAQAGYLLPVPIGAIPAGVRLALRARANTTTQTYTVTLSVYRALDSTQVLGSTQTLTSAPAAADSVLVTPHAVAWASSAWVELLASAATPIGLVGLVHGVVATGAVAGTEWDLGTGAAGAETVATTLRDAQNGNTRTPYTWLPGVFPLSAGTRVALRLRAAGTAVTPVPVALLYVTNP